MRELLKSFVQDIVVEAVEGHQMVTIKNNNGQYITACINRKHVYWSNDVYGMWECFSYDMETGRIIAWSVHNVYMRALVIM